MEKVVVPSGGKPMHLGFTEMITLSPDLKNEIKWTEDYEPPHASYCFFEVTVNQIPLDTFPVGEGHAWSPGSDYFSLTNGYQKDGELRIFRLSDLAYYAVSKSAHVICLDYPTVSYFDYKTETTVDYVFTGDEQWIALKEIPTAEGLSKTTSPAKQKAPASWSLSRPQDHGNRILHTPLQDTPLLDAPKWRRCVALIVDFIAFMLISTAVAATTGSLFRYLDINVPIGYLLPALIGTVFFLYFVMLAGSRYSTPGKAMLGLQVETQHYESVNLLRHLARETIKVISLATGLVLLSGILVMLGKRTIHDSLCSTAVVMKHNTQDG